jgi:hypothetical protein
MSKQEIDNQQEQGTEKKEPQSWVIAELGQIDPRELSPHVPILWRDFPVDQRPYGSPAEEYIRSPYPVSVEILRARWQGLFEERDLRQMRATMEWKTSRLQYQDEVMKQAMKKSISGDIDFQTRRLDHEIVSMVSLIEEIENDLNLKYEYRPAKGKNVGLGYVQTPLSVESKVKLGNLRIALSDCIARRLGLANEVLKVTVAKEESLSERLAVLMAQSDPEFAALQAALDRKMQGGILDGGMLPASNGDNLVSINRAEKEAGRVIDAMPLPRLEN